MACDNLHWMKNNLECNQYKNNLNKSIKLLFDEMKSKLSVPLKQEELFLEVFEDEVSKLGRMATIGQLLGDISVISEVSQTPMSGLELYKRLPCGVDEQLRYDITAFLLIRRLYLNISGKNPSLADIIMPTKLESNGTKLDLNNSDLIGCTVIAGIVLNSIVCFVGLKPFIRNDSKMTFRCAGFW